ncbi:unnamed protein product [Durusdinium trenchii]|uniref:RING-type E3 ubiquitin transferase n=1 Tax=Durusdinium trenchii TaxID=1381693 RepID=A0ABP0PHZ3_9DINO
MADAGSGERPNAERPEDCAVCLEVLGEACPVRKLSCGRSFHHACVAQWLLRRASCPLCKSDPSQTRPENQPFRIDLSHQEMAQFVHEIEDIFRAIHVGVSDKAQRKAPETKVKTFNVMPSEDYAVAISGLGYNLCATLGYEAWSSWCWWNQKRFYLEVRTNSQTSFCPGSLDLDWINKFQASQALGCPLVNFLEALPHFEVRYGDEGEARAVMRPEPTEELVDGKCLTFTVSEREDLWRVVLQGARAQVEIPEIEFSIRPKAERRVDTIYNMIASAVFHLGDHVQKNRRMGGALSEEDCNKICETIEQLNILCLCHKIELLAVGRSFHVSLTRRYLDFIVINVNVPCDAPVFILEGERQCAQMLANHPRFTEHSGKGQKADTCDLDGCSMLLQLF